MFPVTASQVTRIPCFWGNKRASQIPFILRFAIFMLRGNILPDGGISYTEGDGISYTYMRVWNLYNEFPGIISRDPRCSASCHRDVLSNEPLKPLKTHREFLESNSRTSKEFLPRSVRRCKKFQSVKEGKIISQKPKHSIRHRNPTKLTHSKIYFGKYN